MSSAANIIEISDSDGEVSGATKKKANKRRATQDAESSSSLSSPESSDDLDPPSREFAVDKIVDHRVKDKRLEYQVHWKVLYPPRPQQ